MRALRLSVAILLALFLTPAMARGEVLVGSNTLAPWGDKAAAGTAESWQYTAPRSGIVQSVSLYGNTGETTSPVLVGIYSDTHDHPGVLLAAGVISAPIENAWNTVGVTAVFVAAGTKYWLAALARHGTLTVRDYERGHGPTDESQSHSLLGLPVAWATGRVWANSPASFYASGANVLEETGETEPSEEPEGEPGEGPESEEAVPIEQAEREAREHEEQVARESREAEEKAIREREEEATRRHEEQVAGEHEEQVVREHEEQVAREHEEQAARESREHEEQVARESREAEEKAIREREEWVAHRREERARRREERAAREHEAEKQAGKEHEEQAAREHEEQVAREHEEQVARESREAEERASREAEERATREREERAAKEKAEREQREAEERAEESEAGEVGNEGCTTTVNPGPVTVKPGVTCLRSGSYPAISISGVSGATIRPVAGAKASVAGIEISASNVTVRDLYLTKTARVRSGEHNSLIHDEWVGGPASESGVIVWGTSEATEPKYTTIEYDRFSRLNNEPGGASMDGQCGTFIGYWEHVTFSHNVCGPENSGHYTQDGGGSYITEEYNTFLGPSERYKTKTSSDTTGYHTNVFQAFHPGEHIVFSNNVIRNTGTNGNTILIEATNETAPVYNDVRFENNLFERDADGQGPGFCPISNFSYRYNTEIVSIPEGNFGGTVFSARTASGNSDCAEGHNDEISHNLSLEIPCSTTPPQFETGGGTTPTVISPCAGHSPSLLSYDGGSGTGKFCASECVFDYNVTSDTSADQAGSAHHVTGFKSEAGLLWSTLFGGVALGPYGLESLAWQLTTPFAFAVGYQGGGGAPGNVGPK